VPGSLAIISSSFEGEWRGKAIDTWSGFSGITAGLGPILGGFLIQSISWRAAFLINVPLAVVVLFIVFRHVPESRDLTPASWTCREHSWLPRALGGSFKALSIPRIEASEIRWS
jgi:MFS family permease